jgi:hypothetical protein
VNRWEVSTKGAQREGFEVCAERLPHSNSWGWYGRDKIRMEGMNFEDSKRRAQSICDALNAAEKSS